MSNLRIKNSWRRLLLRTIITIAIVSSLIVTVGSQFNRTKSVTKQPIVTKVTNKQTKITIGQPVRLIIPSINVDASIDYTGLTSDGAMDVKKDPEKVTWYSLGPRPGEVGSAVIAGHYGWLDGKGSVFNDLQNLKKGDDITVIDENNVTNYFIVRESRKYDPDAKAPEVFTSSDNKSHLNLVTCNGTWIESKQTYSNRLVIFADKKA